MNLALIDIETTGSHNCGNKITEVAILKVENGKIIDTYHCLVNPDIDIPLPITALTGINQSLIQNAPVFEKVAAEIDDFTKDCVFVAHQVNFDYNFIKAEMASCNIRYQRKRLCTVRYARKVVPGLKSYSLSALCRHFNITNSDPHRAFGDVNATFQLLELLQELDEDKTILTDLIKQSDHAAILPAHLNADNFAELPAAPGVYYLLDKKRKPVYIGKAGNLQKRVLSHFTGSSKNVRKQLFQKEIYFIDFKQTADNLFAALLEDKEIKHFWPKFNLAQKEVSRQFAVTRYCDRLDRPRLGIIKFSNATDNILSIFNSFSAARQWLFTSCIEFNIDPKLAGLPVLGDYNLIDDEHFNPLGIDELTDQCFPQLKDHTVLVKKTAKHEKNAYVFLRKGVYAGFGETEKNKIDSEEIDKTLIPAPASSISAMILRQMMSNNKYEIHKI